MEPVRTRRGARRGDGQQVADVWWYAGHSITSLDSTSYSSLAAAAGITLPAGVGTVATATATPSGRSIDEAEYLPFLSWLALPPPQDLLIFGWMNYCAGPVPWRRLSAADARGRVLQAGVGVAGDGEGPRRRAVAGRVVVAGDAGGPHALPGGAAGGADGAVPVRLARRWISPTRVKVREFDWRYGVISAAVLGSNWWIAAAPSVSRSTCRRR
jgi:hypothetical protein